MKPSSIYLLGSAATLAALYAWPKSRRLVFERHWDKPSDIAIGLGAAAVFLTGYQIAHGFDGSSEPIAPPSLPALPVQPAQPMQPSTPVHLADPLDLVPGRMYWAAVNLGALSFLASVSKVKSYAEGLGFTNVAVFDASKYTPPAWPGPLPTDGIDYYVVGIYSGAPKSMARKSQVVDAWQT